MCFRNGGPYNLRARARTVDVLPVPINHQSLPMPRFVLGRNWVEEGNGQEAYLEGHTEEDVVIDLLR